MDVGLTLLTGFADEDLFVSVLMEAFESRIKVDRASLFTFPPDVPLRTCSAEALIVLKAFTDRPKDSRCR